MNINPHPSGTYAWAQFEYDVNRRAVSVQVGFIQTLYPWDGLPLSADVEEQASNTWVTYDRRRQAR